MVERVVFMRHLQDQDNLFFQNNSPVVDSELDRAGDVAREIVLEAEEAGIEHIHFITSSKARASMTAESIADRARQSLSVSIEHDERIRELDQGKYRLPDDYKPGDNFQVLKDAWLIFFDETFGRKNLWYRFGDPIKNGTEYKYPELAKHFIEYGENQVEFSIRYYSFLSDFYKRFKSQEDVLPIVVTHQALATRFFELGHIATTNQVVTQGNLPLMEWDAYQAIKGTTDELLLGYGGISRMSLEAISNLLGTLDSEVTYLRSLKESKANE